MIWIGGGGVALKDVCSIDRLDVDKCLALLIGCTKARLLRVGLRRKVCWLTSDRSSAMTESWANSVSSDEGTVDVTESRGPLSSTCFFWYLSGSDGTDGIESLRGDRVSWLTLLLRLAVLIDIASSAIWDRMSGDALRRASSLLALIRICSSFEN